VFRTRIYPDPKVVTSKDVYPEHFSEPNPTLPTCTQVRHDVSEQSQASEVYVYETEGGGRYRKPYVVPTAPDRVDIPLKAWRLGGRSMKRYG
jgi:hypothetical protein